MNVKLNKENPCYKCPDRSAICHSVCERYREWSTKVAESRELIRQRKEDLKKTYPSSISKQRNGF